MSKLKVKKIEKTYNIIVKKVSFIRESSDNVVYLIKSTNNQKYIVRVSKRDIRSDVLFETTWLDYLLKQGVSVVEVIKTTNDKPFLLFNESVSVVFKFDEGQHVKIGPHKKPNLKKVENAAHELAKIHNVSLNGNINLSRKRNILTEVSRALDIESIFIKRSEGGDKFVKELFFYKNWAEKHKNNKYLLHDDYRTGNVFFHGDTVSAMLDFDWSCKGPAIKDVAHSLTEWSFPDGDEKHWQDVFNTFMESYNKTANNKISLNNELYHWICFSCLSDVATYFTDLAEEKVFKRISSSYMYKKYLYFTGFLK